MARASSPFPARILCIFWRNNNIEHGKPKLQELTAGFIFPAGDTQFPPRSVDFGHLWHGERTPLHDDNRTHVNSIPFELPLHWLYGTSGRHRIPLEPKGTVAVELEAEVAQGLGQDRQGHSVDGVSFNRRICTRYPDTN